MSSVHPQLEQVLGPQLLSDLTGDTPPSPAQVQFLRALIDDLAGSYTVEGIREWFTRPRQELDGLMPAALLGGSWSPEAAGPAQIRQLAAALRC